MRFHLDEHVPHAIAAGLRRRGIDVTTTVEAGLRGASDDVHLAYALEQQRVIVTNDPDFLVLAQQDMPHMGIACGVVCQGQGSKEFFMEQDTSSAGLPPFRTDGYLPEGVYVCSEAEVVFRFGSASRRRRRLVLRIRRWIELGGR